MSYLFSSLLGISLKLVDDIIDLNIDIHNFYFEFIKSITTLLSVILIQMEPILAIIILLALVISNYCKKFDHEFWFSYMYVIIFLNIYYFKDIVEILTSDKLYKIFIFIIFLPIVIYFEEKTFNEEISKNKTYTRINSIFVNCIMLFFLQYFNFISSLHIEFFAKLIIFVNSYFLTNLIVQYYFIDKKILTKNEDTQEKIKEKQSKNSKGKKPKKKNKK